MEPISPQTDPAAPAADLARFVQGRREELFGAWLDRVRSVPALRMREDVSQEDSRAVLRTFFDLIARQLASPDDFAPLRDYVFSGSSLPFTPDAACRLHLAFKYTLLDALDGADFPPDLHRAAETALDEILLRIAEFCHERRYKEIQRQESDRARVLRSTQERLKTLLETMNEGFTAVDTDQNITLFNQQMEQITGYGRQEVMGRHVSVLYTPESQDRLQGQLARRRQGEASTYELEVAHKEGHVVFVRISGAPLRDDEGHYIGSFAVVTDISKQVQAEQALRQRNDEIERLLESERRRAAYFATINQVARLALSTLDLDEILRRVVHAIQERFVYYHVSLFLVESGTDRMVLRAQAGAYEPCFHETYRQQIGAGIVGFVVASGESLLANDVQNEPRRILAFPEEANTRAELCVPIRLGDRVIGALDVQSQETDVFDENDLAALQVLADQIAWVIHNARLFQDTLTLKEFNEQVLQSIPLPVLLLDPEGRVTFANQSYRERHRLQPETLVGRRLEEAVPYSILVQPEGRQALKEVLQTGQPYLFEHQRVQRGPFQNRTVNMLLSRIEFADETPLVLVVIEDITESLEKAYQSSLLRQIGQTMQGILEPNRLLYAILTCVTAGTALGFNRAILLLVNQKENILEGRMGVGPSSPEEAARIWSDLAGKNPTVEDILSEYDRLQDLAEAPLSRAARQVRIPLDEPDDVLARVARERRTVNATDETAISISPTLWSALGTDHFVAVPLVVKDRALGVIVADNLYSGKPVTEESIDLLTAFAGHAALALENAELYRSLEEKVQELERAYDELERTQEELLHSERLAVIGEMSARMAHEIRNPLATIGGFARSILKKPDPRRLKMAGKIIVEETQRLEELLAETLNFTRPSQPHFEPADPGRLFQDARVHIEDDLENRKIVYRESFAPDLPAISLDAAQIKQVLINILQNAVQAMPEGGELLVSTRPSEAGPNGRCVEIEICDTGEGIPAEHLDQVFSPFFTTKTYGTGLGLAISKKIVEDHAGVLSVESRPGQGTTVRIQLPCERPHPEGQPHENHPDR